MRQINEELKWRQYKYEQWCKRFCRHHVRLLEESIDASLIFQINNALLNGLGSTEEIRKIIGYLIGEHGEGYLHSEQLKYFLKREEFNSDRNAIDYVKYANAFPENEEYQKLANLQLLNK